ncbi:MAG: hypothetical protein EOP92_26385 [Lysobacteraceae bacterium]|nr:MAG: hypothetical protein EOP92_26385 [Xanthomonadaceae bacterium]
MISLADQAMRTARTVILLLPLGLACQAAGATQPAESPEVVRVTGLRAIPWKSYRAMRAAMDAHDTYRTLAPHAVFSFGVVLPSGQKLPPNFAMRVRTPDGTEYPVAMEGTLFKLPVLPDDLLDADLVTNLKGVTVKIGILMETPGLPPGMDRLGDLRLTCQIERAINRIEDDLVARLLRPNVCETSKGSYWMAVRLPSDAATLVEGTRTLALERRDQAHRTTYRIPLHDASWGNDTLVDYKYTKPFPAGLTGKRVRFTLKD